MTETQATDLLDLVQQQLEVQQQLALAADAQFWAVVACLFWVCVLVSGVMGSRR